MHCPKCGASMSDVTDSWQTFAEAEGAEYLAAYVTICRCPACGTMVGTHKDAVEWVIVPEPVLQEE